MATETARKPRPSPALVIWGSIALFAAMFTLLTHQLSAAEVAKTPRPALVRTVIKRRVITTVLPTPGRSSVTSSGSVAGVSPAAYSPITTSAS